MAPPFLSADEVLALVPMSDMVEALRCGFEVRHSDEPRSVVNLSLPNEARTMLAMPAASGGVGGCKLITLLNENPGRGKPAIQGIYVLFSPVDGRVRALLDGGVLTMLRTPAASALATDYLAASEPDRMGLFGTGVQALGHIEAMRVVRPSLRRVDVVSATPGRAEAFAATASDQIGIEVVPAATETAASAPLVCCATRADSRLFRADQLAPGAHVNAIGSYRPGMGEFGSDVVDRAEVWVDHRDAAALEAGELIEASASDGWAWSRVRGDLSDLISNRPGHDPSKVTLFKSVGLSTEDLVAAQLAADLAGIEA